MFKGPIDISSVEVQPETRHALAAKNLAVSADRQRIAALAATLESERLERTHRRTIYLDTSDLIEYVKHNNTVSGIQRVVANLIEHAPEMANLHDVDVVFVYPEYQRSRIYAVDGQIIDQLLHALDEAGNSRTALERAIQAVYSSRKIIVPKAGDIFTIAGAFWTYENYDLLLQLRRSGVGVINFIHDLIQISHPEFVFEAATRQFRGALIDILSSSTALLTNSEYVAEDVRRFIGNRTDVDIPVLAVPLATELAPRRENDGEVSQETADVLSTSYVLSVSTIEVRKNHQLMVRIWERLIEEGITDLPDLVFVGKIGWDIAPFIEYLEMSNYLGGKVKILSRVSDAELAALYRSAQFTMYMSYVEGFGLPVAESLAYGVPCIASNRSSMPEVGGTLARYVDPDDVDGGATLVRRLVEHEDELADWRSEIAQNFRIRTWKQFSADYVAGLLSFAKPDARPYNNRFRAGELYGMGRWEIMRRDAYGKELTYLANTREYGWNANEDWGCWSASRKAALRLVTDFPAGTCVTVYILVKAPGRDQAVELSIQVGNQVDKLGTISSEVWRTVECEVGVQGVIDLAFIVDGPRPQVDDVRDLYVGCIGIAFCERSDTNGRLAILEEIALNPKRMGEPPNKPRPSFDSSTLLHYDQVDPEWYIEEYPDVHLVDLSPEEHYRWIGKRLGRKPNVMAFLDTTEGA